MPPSTWCSIAQSIFGSGHAGNAILRQCRRHAWQLQRWEATGRNPPPSAVEVENMLHRPPEGMRTRGGCAAARVKKRHLRPPQHRFPSFFRACAHVPRRSWRSHAIDGISRLQADIHGTKSALCGFVVYPKHFETAPTQALGKRADNASRAICKSSIRSKGKERTRLCTSTFGSGNSPVGCGGGSPSPS